ncbi:MAG TPA: hypothetical protein PLZ36_12745, partial [Armatimonadota bacterium]|nr:hypothetical protein [Armatimonadota bacterium]
AHVHLRARRSALEPLLLFAGIRLHANVHHSTPLTRPPAPSPRQQYQHRLEIPSALSLLITVTIAQINSATHSVVIVA